MLSTGKGRGRGRSYSRPFIDSISFSQSLTPVTASATSSSPSQDSPAIDDNQSESGISSASISTNSSKSSPTSTNIGRGRGRGSHIYLKSKYKPDDPHWTVTNLTYEQFYSSNRPKKPDQLGTLGEHIQVLANYFPLLQFPYKGLVYKYQIQIRNRKDFEIHRDRRRVLYNSWLQGLCRQHPDIDKHKIVFDNHSRVLTFDQPLPDTYENEVSVHIMGPNRSDKQEFHTVIVQRVGNPVDLSMLQNLNQLFDMANESNEKLEELQDIKQVLSIALHEHCSSHAAFTYTRSFFAPTIEGQYGEWDLGYGKAMWRGFYSCLVFARGKHQLLMNLDVKHTVFLKKQPFLDFICEIMLHSPCGKRDYGRQRDARMVDGNDAIRYLDSRSPTYESEANFLLKHCKHLRVRSQDASKPIIYEIKKLGLPASRQEFEWKSNQSRRITVANYYKEHYNLELKYPSLPTLETRSGSYIPMEFVDVEPAKIKKITDEQRALLCKNSSMKPAMYYKSINKIRTNLKQQCFEQDPFVAAWNLSVDVQMITVAARVLPMPEIFYTNEYRVKSIEDRYLGTWELRATRFNKPSDFPKVWAMINLSSLTKDACVEFYYELSIVAKQRGINCPAPEIYEECNAENYPANKIVTLLEDLMNKIDDCRLVIVILPNGIATRTQIYGHLKKLCELEEYGFGIVTQMIRAGNSVIGTRKDRTKWDYGKFSNILLKLNTKLNGTNSIIKVPDIIDRFFSRGHRIMYVGADLSHPAPGTQHQTSVAAVVASADDVPNRYFKEIYKQNRLRQAQAESRDYIVNMEEIMKSLIQKYERHRGYPPTTIVIYRDGISEGEFYTVFEKELMAIRHACVDLSPVYRPYITYIVVNKRHHTRFFSTNSDSNVLAGTVVDSHDITNPTTYDFYLNSHHGALGTSRPTHYHVLYDDNKLKPDEVQMLTYALCYTYARCTRSVSIPTPVKYADLLATRAALYLENDDGSDTESIASGPRIPINQDIDIKNIKTGERIVLSSKLDADCPFFV